MNKLLTIAAVISGFFGHITDTHAAPYMNVCSLTFVSATSNTSSSQYCVQIKDGNDTGAHGLVEGNTYFGSDQWKELTKYDVDDNLLTNTFNIPITSIDLDRNKQGGSFTFDISQSTFDFSRLMLSLKAGKSFNLYLLNVLPAGDIFAVEFGGLGKNLSHVTLFGDGEVSTVPLPAAAWFFGPAVIGLVGWAKRRKKT